MRIDEIKARLSKINVDSWDYLAAHTHDGWTFVEHAPKDIQYLLKIVDDQEEELSVVWRALATAFGADLAVSLVVCAGKELAEMAKEKENVQQNS